MRLRDFCDEFSCKLHQIKWLYHTMRFWRIGSENRVCQTIPIKVLVTRGDKITNLQLANHFGTGPQQNMALGKPQTTWVGSVGCVKKIPERFRAPRGDVKISNLQLANHFGTGPQQNMALGKPETTWVGSVGCVKKIPERFQAPRGDVKILNLQLTNHFGTGPQQNMAPGKP